MTRLSVNINKVAWLRNARGGNTPDVLQAAKDCEKFGAQGITVHPRPDERHIRYSDVRQIAPVLQTELNIEGYPSRKWLDLVTDIRPAQATLVPDDPDQLTSDHGWDTIKHEQFLKDVTGELQAAGCRVSLFLDPAPKFIEGARAAGVDRIELYTGPYAEAYPDQREKAVAPYRAAAKQAHGLGLGVNAGHDLNLHNLRYLFLELPHLDEVSIGHALISDALYYGLRETIQQYLKQLKPT